jgi:hypothetical protein
MTESGVDRALGLGTFADEFSARTDASDADAGDEKGCDSEEEVPPNVTASSQPLSYIPHPRHCVARLLTGKLMDAIVAADVRNEPFDPTRIQFCNTLHQLLHGAGIV